MIVLRKQCSICNEMKRVEDFPFFDAITCRVCTNVKRQVKRQLPKTKKFISSDKARRMSAETEYALEDWEAAMLFFKGSCAYCGSKTRKVLTKDHVLPLSKRGKTVRHNIVPACRKCNTSRGNKLLKEYFNYNENFTEARYQRIVQWYTNEYE